VPTFPTQERDCKPLGNPAHGDLKEEIPLQDVLISIAVRSGTTEQHTGPEPPRWGDEECTSGPEVPEPALRLDLRRRLLPLAE
jgi:hypothetical protein